MVGWLLVFTMASVLAAIIGFTGILAVAKVVFWILLVLFLVVLLMSVVGHADRSAVR